jgi:hypothetical protein
VACTLLLPGCPGDDTGDEGASADEHGHETEGHGTTEHGTTEHGTAEHGTAEHGTAEHGTGVETSANDPAIAYCACAFANCHDLYHDKWSDDERGAEAACLAEAQALPVNGSDIDLGNFIECRMHFCELAADDETLCANVLGDAVCM